jgi:hypothetical protein
MARDLIPPPSPAGRPTSPDGTPNLIELPPDRSFLTAEPVASPPPGPSEFRNRFGFLLGALAGVFIAAALAAAVVIANSGGNGAQDEGLASNWSRWQPTDTTIGGGAKQIAEHVGAEYKHPDGKQLVQISGEELPSEFTLTVRPSSGPVTNIDGTRVIYQLDGLGPNGTIKGGKPSTTRAKVIQREALELALYTFRYLPDAESVTMLLPPAPPTDAEKAAAQAAAAAAAVTGASSTTPPTPQPAIFYRPGDLKPQLQVPLGQTLGPKVPSTDSYTGPELTTVITLTGSNSFLMTQPTQGHILLDRPDNP